MEKSNRLAERLKELMSERNIKAPALANALGVRSNAITRYLQGVHAPSLQTLVALCEYFDCSADFLLGLSEYPKREGQAFKPVAPFCERFRAVMKACNFTQYALQKKTGISWANFSKWLNGTGVPFPDSLITLATAMDCSVDFLLGRED